MHDDEQPPAAPELEPTDERSEQRWRARIRPEGATAWAELSGQVVGGHLICELKAPEELREAIGFLSQELRAVSSAARADPSTQWKPLCARVQAYGFEVVEIPSADLQVTLQLDLKTGRAVGRHHPLHPFAGDNADLSAQVFAALRKALREPVAILATRLETLVEHGQHDEAATALLVARDAGELSFGSVGRLANGLRGVVLEQVQSERRIAFAKLRAPILGEARQHIAAGRDAQFVLDQGASESADECAALRTIVAVAHISEDRRETGISQLLAIAEDVTVSDKVRGWAYQNLSLALELSDPGCALYASKAADFFLQGGDPAHAARIMMRAAEAALHSSPQSAQSVIDAALSLTQGDADLETDGRGQLLLAKAEYLLRMRQGQEALACALDAANCFRGLLGAEVRLLRALVIAGQAGKASGTALAEEIEAERALLASKIFGEDAELRQRAADLFTTFDRTTVERIRSSIAAGHTELQDPLDVLIASKDPDLADIERLRILETVVRREAAHVPRTQRIGLMALVEELLRQGKRERAVESYKELLRHDPLHWPARNNVPMLLHSLGRHAEALAFLENQLLLWGPLPGIRVALGRALMHCEQFNRAANEFLAASTDPNASEAVKTTAQTLLAEAALQGGQVTVTSMPRTVNVTRQAWEHEVARFSDHIKSSVRPSFWRGRGNKKKWVSQPERHAQNLLRTHIHAAFGDAVECFDELNAGAGRIDLYLVFSGGLRLVVELKMLGAGYSATYAASGATQVEHYMANRKCHLGYLVLFDARIDQWGSEERFPLQAANRIFVRFVDVRTAVK